MEYQINTNQNLHPGCTFSEATSIYKQSGKKNLFEDLITLNTIEEDINLSDKEKQNLINILNSNIDSFEKRIRIMRALDKEKEFSSQIALVLRDNLPKMEMVEKILYVFRDHYVKSDVLKKEYGEVLTPASTMKEMIESIDSEFWKSPYNKDGSIKRILESSNGSGIFLWGVISKFMIGLKNHFPDENDRYKFIVENMIYACELQKSKMFHWICIADLYDEYDLNVYCGSFLEDGFDKHMKEVWSIDKFSLCLSNPPYQEMDGGAKASAKPIYNLFTLKSIKICDKVLFITPSRWFAGGKGLDSYRKFMISSNKIKLIRHFDDASKIFGKSVDITGGVSYFLFDNLYNGKCLLNNQEMDLRKYDIIIENENDMNLVERVMSNVSKGLDSICMGRGDNVFGIQSNDIRFKSGGDLKCYVSKQKGFIKNINRHVLKNTNLIDEYKVVTAESNGEYPKFGNKFIASPGEVLSGSYIWFLVKSESEAKSLLSYLNTKFANKLLSIRKISQHIKPDTCKWIPLVPLNQNWTDEKLFELFGLTEMEKKIIDPNYEIDINKNLIQILIKYGFKEIQRYYRDDKIEVVDYSIIPSSINKNLSWINILSQELKSGELGEPFYFLEDVMVKYGLSIEIKYSNPISISIIFGQHKYSLDINKFYEIFKSEIRDSKISEIFKND